MIGRNVKFNCENVRREEKGKTKWWEPICVASEEINDFKWHNMRSCAYIFN